MEQKSRVSERRAAPGPVLRPIVIAEVGLAMALAAIFHVIKFPELPQGGSISLEMLPIVFMAFRRGPAIGALSGALFGVVQLILKAYVVHPAQFLLDYPLAFAVLGVAGLTRRRTLGILLASALRYLAHVVSGAIFFASYAPKGSNVWVYSLVYNATYMVPSAIVVAVAIWAIGRRGGLLDAGAGKAGR